MSLLELPNDLFEMIIEETADSNSKHMFSTLQLRSVNKTFNAVILRWMFARIVHFPTIRHYIQIHPFMGKFIYDKYDMPCCSNSQLVSVIQRSLEILTTLSAARSPEEGLSKSQEDKYLYALTSSAGLRLDLLDTLDLLSTERYLPLSPTESQYGALVAASAIGEIEIMEELITNIPDVDYPSLVFCSALTAAVINGQDASVHLLLENGARICDVGMWQAWSLGAGRHEVNHFTMACYSGYVKVLELILRPKYHWSENIGRGHAKYYYERAMWVAVQPKSSELLECLRSGSPENQIKTSLLVLEKALNYGNYQLARSMIEDEGVGTVYFESEGYYSHVIKTRKGYLINLLHHACGKRNPSLVKLFMGQGIGFDSNCLYFAASAGDEALVELILGSGVDVRIGDKVDSHGDPLHSPLWGAILSGQVEMVRFLKARGAVLNYIDEGADRLRWACESGDVSVIQALAEAGIDPTGTPVGGRYNTPMYEAVKAGHSDVVKVLLDLGSREVESEVRKRLDDWERSIGKDKRPYVDPFPNLDVIRDSTSILGPQRKP